MAGLLLTWRLATRRGRSNWRMLGVVWLGVLVASTLLASAPIYSRAMADLGLVFAVRENLQDRPGLHVEFQDVEMGTAAGAARRAAIEERIMARVGWFESGRSLQRISGRYEAIMPDAVAGRPRPLGQVQSLDGYEEHVRLVEGKLPGYGGPGTPIEVAISGRVAGVSRLGVGSRFELLEDSDTCERQLPRENEPPPPPCTPTAGIAFTFPVLVVGIIEPLDEKDWFWGQAPSLYFAESRPLATSGPQFPLLASVEGFEKGAGGRLPAYPSVATWRVSFDSERISRATFDRARKDIRALSDDAGPAGGFAYGPFVNTLQDYDRDVRHREGPLTILLLEISGVALFYVALVSAMVVERQAAEIGLLRARGASSMQVAAVYLVEGLLLGGAAVVVAPFLAAGATALLGTTPLFEDVTGGARLPATILPSAFWLAAAGAALSLLALVLPAWVVARRGALAQRRTDARPGVSFIQRFYLDVVLAVAAGLLLFELRERGSVFTPSSTGGVSSDPLLLASPALLITAAAALVLRFYPLLMRVAAKVAVTAGVTVAMGAWQVARSPGQYTRLALLLMMAVAVGTFAASYSSTAERSFRDQASFQAGAEWRAMSSGMGTLGLKPSEADALLAAVPGAEAASAVLRTQATIATPGSPGATLQVLALDPSQARDMLWFRDDFAEGGLDGLMDAFAGAGQLRGKPLPEGTETISAWVHIQSPKEETTVWARVRDSQQNYALVDLGKLDTEGWREMSGQIADAYGPDMVGQVTLVAILLTEPPNRVAAGITAVLFDDIIARTADGKVTIIDDFEGALNWTPKLLKAVRQDDFVLYTEDKHGGRAAGRFLMLGGSNNAPMRGFYVPDLGTPLPVIASESFGAPVGMVALVEIGDTVIPVVVRATFRLFPTLPAAQGPALVFERGNLASWLSTWGSVGLPSFNEAWLTIARGADRELAVEALREPQIALPTLIDRTAALDAIDRDPLVSAGGTGILYLAFISLLVLVAAALLASLWSAVQRRRTEFSVMRALGFSRGQVLRQVALEYMVVGIVGLVAGGYLGRLIGSRMLSFLDVTEEGARVEPSYVLETDWAMVGMGTGVLFALFLVALVAAGRFLGRVSAAEALRTE